jgi:hypothetical protein
MPENQNNNRMKRTIIFVVAAVAIAVGIWFFERQKEKQIDPILAGASAPSEMEIPVSTNGLDVATNNNSPNAQTGATNSPPGLQR